MYNYLTIYNYGQTKNAKIAKSQILSTHKNSI